MKNLIMRIRIQQMHDWDLDSLLSFTNLVLLLYLCSCVFERFSWLLVYVSLGTYSLSSLLAVVILSTALPCRLSYSTKINFTMGTCSLLK